MSIDTDSLRHDADQACVGKFLVDIRSACDEIDNLRGRVADAEHDAASALAENDRLLKENSDLRKEATVSLNRAEAMRIELANLREMLDKQKPLWRDTYYSTLQELDKTRIQLRTTKTSLEIISTEIANLREQLRPRSIKEEPPKPRLLVFVYCPTSGWQIRSFSSEVDILDQSANNWITHWLPMPPAPPQPNKFKGWWDSLPEGGHPYPTKVIEGSAFTEPTVRSIWDACEKAHGFKD